MQSFNKNDFKAYLFVYFAGEKYADGEQIYFAVSQDGLNWQDLNNNHPVLRSSMGEGGVRDPFAVRHPDTGVISILATDLNIYDNGNWRRAVCEGSRNIIVWQTENLIDFSEQKMISLAVEGAGCCWAPEACYDKSRQDFLIYWASTNISDDFAKQRVYASFTQDFLSYTVPFVMIEKLDHAFDTTMLEYDGYFYRYLNSDEAGGIVAEKTDTIDGKGYVSIPSPVLSAQKKTEGSFIFQLNGQKKWCLLIDESGGNGYYPLLTDDLASGDFHRPQSYTMPSRARHGSVLPITLAEYEILCKKWLRIVK